MVLLSYNRGYNWSSVDNIHFKGFFFIGEKLLRGVEAIAFLQKHNSFNEIIEVLPQLNGQYSFIIEKEKNFLFAVDRLRTFPLFYQEKGHQIFISDSVQELVALNKQFKINPTAKSQFLASGYTHDDLTLIENIHQVEAGEYILFNGQITKQFYYNYYPDKISHLPLSELTESFKSIINTITRKLTLFLTDKTPVVPLSSGYDSRLIVTLLKMAGFNNVICVTFGKEGNSELNVSRKVAEKLGYRWIFIPYTIDLINGYLDSQVFTDYYKYASNYTSMFYMQEYFAIKKLSEENIIPDNSVFLPGHCGDLIAGSHLWGDVTKNISATKLAEKLYAKNFNLVIPPRKVKKKIKSRLNSKLKYKSPAYAKLQNWELKERQPKFIINSSNVFSYFGYEYYMPLGDKEFMEFFTNLPLKHLINRNFYINVLSNDFFTPMNIDLNRKVLPSAFDLNLQLAKTTIKNLLPWSIKKIFFHHEDTFNYRLIIGAMIEDMKKRKYPVNERVQYENSFIVQWYISVLENNKEI